MFQIWFDETDDTGIKKINTRRLLNNCGAMIKQNDKNKNVKVHLMYYLIYVLHVHSVWISDNEDDNENKICKSCMICVWMFVWNMYYQF